LRLSKVTMGGSLEVRRDVGTLSYSVSYQVSVLATGPAWVCLPVILSSGWQSEVLCRAGVAGIWQTLFGVSGPVRLGVVAKAAVGPTGRGEMTTSCLRRLFEVGPSASS